MIHELGTQAYSALRHNKRRSILTMLGMAWGIATVVLLLAYGAGFERGLWAAFRSFGTNLVFVFPGPHLAAGGRHQGRKRSPSHRQRSGLHPRRSASAQAALSRSVQAMQRGLGHAQRQLWGERRVRELCPHAPHGICRRHSLRRGRGLSPTRASLLSGPTPRRNFFPARMRSARASAWTASLTRSWAS